MTGALGTGGRSGPIAASTGPLRVVLADDEPLARAGLRCILESVGDIVVVAEAGDGIEAERAAERVDADVVLMDLRMPRRDGIAATRAIRSRPASPHVLVLTTFEVDADILAALDAGAVGFLLKDASPEEFIAAVRAVAAGLPYLPPAHQRLVLDGLRSRAPGDRAIGRSHQGAGETGVPGAPATPTASGPPPAPAPPGNPVDPGAVASPTAARARLAPLSPRERDVCAALARGLSNGQIAELLGCSESMVKAHLVRVFAKLGVDNRVQVAILAHDAGLDLA